MTDIQLDIKATKASLAYNIKYAEDSVLNDMLSRPSDFVTDCIKSVVDMLRKKAYRDGYEQGFKELENEYKLKLKDTSLVRALKDSIIMNEKLSSQEQQELCAWIEAAMEFGENLDECAKENEQLKKNAIVWHKVTCFDEPNENGFITASNPVDEGKDYLVLLKNKRIAISGLAYDDDGYFFEDFDWEDIEAWAELPEV